MKTKLLLPLVLFATLFSSCFETEEPAYLDKDGVPIPTNSYVNDFTGKTLENSEIDTLNSILESYEDSTTTQIVVIIMPTLPSQWGDIADLAFETGDRWGIGQEETDNGILLLILLNDHKMFIATGYGVEGALTDIMCSRICQNYISPKFKDEDYYEGIQIGVSYIKKVLAGEFTEKDAEYEDKMENQKINFFATISIVAIILITIGSIFEKPLLVAIIQAIATSVTWFVIFGHFFSPFWSILAISFFVVLILSFLGKEGFFSKIVSGSGGGSGGGGGGFFGGGGSFGGGGGGGSW